MPKESKKTRPLLRAALAGILATAPALSQAAARTAPAGMASRPSYLDTQAAAGAELYAAACQMCHGAQLAGNFQTPPLTGRFVGRWAGAPLSDLASYIHDAMPLMAPGTLSDDAVASLVAYILSRNGVPPGRKALPANGRPLARLTFPATRLP